MMIRITEFIDRVVIEQDQEPKSAGTITKRMEIPKVIMSDLQEGIGNGERLEVESVDEEGFVTTYLFVPESPVSGGICPGPCMGPTLVVENNVADRLMIELTDSEVELLADMDLTNRP